LDELLTVDDVLDSASIAVEPDSRDGIGLDDAPAFPALKPNGTNGHGRGARRANGSTRVATLNGYAVRSTRAVVATTYRRLLGVADALAISFAMWLAVVVNGHHLAWAALAVPVAFVVLAKVIGLYDRDEHLLHKTTLDEAPKLFGFAAASTLMVSLGSDVVSSATLGRGQVLILWSTLFVSLVVLRSVARLAVRSSSPPERCLFIGDAVSVEELREKLATSPAVNAELVGWLPAHDSSDLERGAVLSEQVRTMIDERNIHRVILGPGPGSSAEILNSIARIRDHGLKVSLLPDVSRVVSSSTELDRLNGITLLGVRGFGITRSSQIIKRTFDLVGSVAFIILTAPVVAVTAFAIKLDSPGPVFFRQERAGRHGKHFWIWKLRSMVEDAEDRREELMPLNQAEGFFKMADDPRMTRVGRVIRRLHIDEIPQLFNVARGDMSLIGPRPLPLEEDERIVGWHRRRLDLKPGITGPWQILGSARVPLREMVNMDYQYVADWSLWNDVRILLLTIGHVARRRGQ
jgi:exopolysaccharide biosynthesis polyprenyl glycosylphosphotransferase